MVTMRYVDQLVTYHQNKSRNGYLQIVYIYTSSGGLELTWSIGHRIAKD